MSILTKLLHQKKKREVKACFCGFLQFHFVATLDFWPLAEVADAHYHCDG
jgi:hypothetical protein